MNTNPTLAAIPAGSFPSTGAGRSTRRWGSIGPDVVAWALGLGVAWAWGWTTTDLVWSLWLSSLVVGYSLIVWSIIEPALELAAIGWRERASVEKELAQTSWPAIAGGIAVVLAIGVFALGFFTIHFGGFHYVHSQFLISIFPLDAHHRSADLATYVEVARRYWWALPSAFLAQRAAFLQRTFETSSAPPDVSVTVAAIAARKAKSGSSPSRMTIPYVAVMKMHLLIFVFLGTHAAHLDGFWLYALVYTVYFFPWKVLRSTSPA